MSRHSRPANQDSIAQFDLVIRRARWLSIVVVLATLPYKQIDLLWFFGLTAFGIVFNLTQYLQAVKKSRFLSSTLFVTTVDLFFIGIVLGLVGGVRSPYVLLFLFSVLFVTFQRTSTKITNIVFVLLTISVILLVNTVVPVRMVRYSDMHRSIILVLLLMVLAYFVNRLTEGIRTNRREALKLRKSAEAERQKLVTLIDSMDEGVMAVGSDHKVSLHNATIMQLLEVQQLQGVSIQKLPALGLPSGGQTSFMQLLEPGTASRRRDLTISRGDGSKTKLEISIAPLKDAYGELSDGGAFIIMMHDITTEKTLEDERHEFLSIISHELRTPVASAEAGISMLLNKKITQLDDNGRQFAGIAYSQISFLAELVNDIGTLSKLEDDIFTVDPEVLHIKQFLGEINQEYVTSVEKKGLKLKIDIGKRLPAVITSVHEVKEIMQNFITNAIKYTEHGTITIACKAAEKPVGGIILSVKDSGIGIAQNDISRVFDKFYRSEDYRTRKTGGTGLGLYISQRLADRLGARIWVESKLNKGTTFFIHLPPYSSVKKDQRQVMEAQMETLISTI